MGSLSYRIISTHYTTYQQDFSLSAVAHVSVSGTRRGEGREVDQNKNRWLELGNANLISNEILIHTCFHSLGTSGMSSDTFNPDHLSTFFASAYLVHNVLIFVDFERRNYPFLVSTSWSSFYKVDSILHPTLHTIHRKFKRGRWTYF